MNRISRRLAAALLALLTVGVITFSGAQAAFAATYHSCISGSWCLYQWTNFTGPDGPSGRYQRAISSVWHDPTGCWDILAWWPNNTPVSGNSWSFVVNPAGAYQGPDWRFHFYTGSDCSGTEAAVSMEYETETAQLNAPFRAGTPGIRSVSVSLLV